MSKYAKQQEYRLLRKLEADDRVDVLQYYGSRVKNAGDFLVKIGKHQVRIDHKSTTSDTRVSIQKGWLPKLIAIGLDRAEKEGGAIPVIVISLKRRRQFYVLTTRHVSGNETPFPWLFGAGKKSKIIYGGMLVDMGGKIQKVNFDGYMGYMMKLEVFIEEVYKDHPASI